ncbi:MAG: hypothetical protein GXP57_09315 [Deltaproteobacteria bacterium]|nr:hypothetical protein [Deltaproteobacteria bacterium]
MKRLAFLLLIVLGGGILAYLLSSRYESGIDPVDILPPGTVAVVDWTNPAGSYERFKESRLGVRVAAIDWPRVLRGLDTPARRIRRIEETRRKIRQAVNTPLFRELFGGRVVLALLPAVPGSKMVPAAALRKNLVLIVRPRHRASFIDLLSSFFAGRLKFRTRSYRDIVIKSLALDRKLSLSTAVTGGLILISLAPEPLERCLDQSFARLAGGRSGLNGDFAYRNLRERARRQDDLFCYLDLVRLRTMLNRLVAAGPDAESAAALKKIVAASGPFQSVALFRKPGRMMQNYSGVVRFEPRLLNEVQKKLYTGKPVQDKVLATIPAGRIFYFWMNTLDLRTWWQAALTDARPDDARQLRRLQQWLIDNTGRTPEELFAMLGHQFSLGLTRINTSGLFPVPRLCCRVAVVDQKGIQAVLDKMLAGVPVRTDTVAGVPVTSIMLAGGLMQPSYAMVDGFLVIADSRAAGRSTPSCSRVTPRWCGMPGLKR